jgi:hypothetical protein
MNRLVYGLLVLPLLAGCRGGVETDVLEHEVRMYEDRLFAMHDKLATYENMLESCRRENQALKRELDLDDAAASPALDRARPGRLPPDDDVPQFEPLEIEPGIPAEPDLELPDFDAPPADEGASYEALPLEGPSQHGEAVADYHVPEGTVSELIFNKLLTGGLNTDGHEGDEGVMAVVQPRSVDGTPVMPLGDFSLMIMRPAPPGPPVRIARWDFTNEEARLAWRRSLLGEGMHFSLPWPAEAPAGGEYELWARLIAPTGQKHLANTTIRVEPSTGPAAGVAAGRHHRDGFTPRSASDRTLPRGWNARPVTEAAPDEARPNVAAQRQPQQESSERAPDRPIAPLNEPAEQRDGDRTQTAGRPNWQPYR